LKRCTRGLVIQKRRDKKCQLTVKKRNLLQKKYYCKKIVKNMLLKKANVENRRKFVNKAGGKNIFF